MKPREKQGNRVDGWSGIDVGSIWGKLKKKTNFWIIVSKKWGNSPSTIKRLNIGALLKLVYNILENPEWIIAIWSRFA